MHNSSSRNAASDTFGAAGWARARRATQGMARLAAEPDNNARRERRDVVCMVSPLIMRRSRQQTHLRLNLLEPVRHAHVAVHRRRRRDVLPGLLALAGAPVEPAQPKVAVGDEGAHAELLGEGQRVTGVAE